MDIKGIERGVCGFSKASNQFGHHVMVVEYKLDNINLNKLRKIFNVDLNSDDPGVIDMIYPLDINAEQAEKLNKYVINGQIDTDKYIFELHCWEKPDKNS